VTAKLRKIHAHLVAAYGPRPWRRWGNGVGTLVGTILSQNTSNKNSAAGYRQLRRRFPMWEQVARADMGEVERCIRVSGLSNLKAPRIQSILRKIRDERGRIDLEFLQDFDDRAAFDYLRTFNGVGPKTAACVLLFAFGKHVFPVDTHIHRIALRLGLIPPRTPATAAQDILEAAIPPALRYEMHILLIEHGRRICKAGRPRCGECVLRRMCATGRMRGAAKSD
jgi:endonuclease-3